MLDVTGIIPWAFTDTLAEGVYVVDAHGLCIFANAAAARLLGYEAATDLVGQHMHDAIHHTRPDGTVFLAEACPLLHTLSSGRPVRLDNELLWRKDGSSFIAEYSSFPLVAADGTIKESVVTFVERSKAGDAPTAIIETDWRDAERRKAEEELRISEARFRTLANSIPQLAWMASPGGSIDWYNRRWYEYTGTTPDEMRGSGWKSVHHPDHVDRVVAHINRSFSEGASWEDTFPLRGADGTFRWFLSRAEPIRGEPDERYPEGRILGWFGTNTDINDLRETEERLSAAMIAADEANRAKSDFIANMSHELRTPLSAIIGYSEMIREEMVDGAEATELMPDLQKVEANARHLLGLINDVLDLSKIESGKMEVFAETFDVSTIMHEVASTVGALVAKNENVLEIELPSELGAMHSDATKLRQILLNFLSNAAKFTEQGTITLSATRITNAGPVDWLSFRVKDTGIGMSQEQLAKLFQRFTQADASTTRKFGGTGLGLSISKAFSVMLGGDIAVESDPGRGTSFTVIVPASCPAAEVGEDLSPADGSEGVRAAPLRDKGLVLVIDDDEAQRDLMCRFLAREGFGAVTASNGVRGLELARALKPKVILLDVMMPGMDGWSVLSALKADPELANIPVVMITFVRERGLARSLGAAEYVMKPVEWDRFKHVMDQFRGTGHTVLVIDDDQQIRDRLRTALERDGWSVCEAADGQQGLDRAATDQPAIVLLDLHMPVMDGFTFLTEFRKRPGSADTPVVVLTAGDLSLADRKRLRGASQILNKGDTSLVELAKELHTLADAEAEA